MGRGSPGPASSEPLLSSSKSAAEILDALGRMRRGLRPPSQELLPASSVGNPKHLGRGDSERLEETEGIM